MVYDMTVSYKFIARIMHADLELCQLSNFVLLLLIFNWLRTKDNAVPQKTESF